MSILKQLFGQKRTIQSPIFVKDFSKENQQLTDLNELLKKVEESEIKETI